MRELSERLLHDLREIGIDTEGFELVLRPFSKSYFGRYEVIKRRVIVYVYKDAEKNERYDYTSLMKTAIHEVVHHLQYQNPDFVRYKGIMHDAQFKRMYKYYAGKYYRTKIRGRLLCHQKTLNKD